MWFYTRNIRIYTQMQRQSSRPNCMRTGNDETMNANYDLDDQWTMTDSDFLRGLKLKDL